MLLSQFCGGLIPENEKEKDPIENPTDGGKKMDWSDASEDVLTMTRTQQTVETIPGFTHYDWKSYEKQWPEGLQDNVKNGHFEHVTAAGTKGVRVPRIGWH